MTSQLAPGERAVALAGLQVALRRAWLWLLVAAVWIVLAVVISVRSAPATDALRDHGGRTTATIAVLTPDTKKQAGRIGFLYVVNKKVYAQSLVVGPRTAGYRRGEIIPIYYDRQEPGRYSLGVVAVRKTSQLLVLALLYIAGLLLLGWGGHCLRRALAGRRLAHGGEWSPARVAKAQLLGNRVGPGSKVYLTLEDGRLIRASTARSEPEVLVSTAGRRALLVWPEQHALHSGALPRSGAQEARWLAQLPKA